MYEGLRLMAVHAHPDDESSKGAAAAAKYVDLGARVMVVSCTGGERGDILNPALRDHPHILRDIAQVRRDEMRAAAGILGIEHTWLGFVDSGLPEGDPLPPLPEGCFALEDLATTSEALVRVIRDFRPHVVTTYDELGGYPHPDHVMTHTVSMVAFDAAGDPAAFPRAGEPWQPLKLYYNAGRSKARYLAIHEAMVEGGHESPYAEILEKWVERRPEGRLTHVPAADYFETRDRALIAHATQVDPKGWFFNVPVDVQKRIWPTDDFEQVVSFVPIDRDEDDLFAGLGTPAEADALARSGGLTPVFDERRPQEGHH